MSGRGFARFSPSEWSNAITRWYYEILNEDKGFQDALADLFAAISQLEPLPDNLHELYHYDEHMLGILGPPEVEAPPASKQELDQERNLCLRAMRLNDVLSQFQGKWALPDRAGEDLYDSYKFYYPETTRLKLLATGGTIPMVGDPKTAGSLVLGDKTIHVAMFVPTITVHIEEQFTYNPIFQDRKWLNERIDELCSRVKKNIISQAKMYEQEAKEHGWDRRPPRFDTEHLKLLARRLYRRCVLSLTWDEIASAETDDDPTAVVEADTIRKTTHAAANRLGISLKPAP